MLCSSDDLLLRHRDVGPPFIVHLLLGGRFCSCAALAANLEHLDGARDSDSRLTQVAQHVVTR